MDGFPPHFLCLPASSSPSYNSYQLWQVKANMYFYSCCITRQCNRALSALFCIEQLTGIPDWLVLLSLTEEKVCFLGELMATLVMKRTPLQTIQWNKAWLAYHARLLERRQSHLSYHICLLFVTPVMKLGILPSVPISHITKLVCFLSTKWKPMPANKARGVWREKSTTLQGSLSV